MEKKLIVELAKQAFLTMESLGTARDLPLRAAGSHHLKVQPMEGGRGLDQAQRIYLCLYRLSGQVG
jgi:hypothetical protein